MLAGNENQRSAVVAQGILGKDAHTLHDWPDEIVPLITILEITIIINSYFYFNIIKSSETTMDINMNRLIDCNMASFLLWKD